jgi:hypothetical protein
MNRTIITVAAIAALAVAALAGAAAASAATIADYRQALTDAGYTISAAAAATKHPTLHADGQALTATKGGQFVTLEVIEYTSRAKLLEDFVAVNGSGPKPAVATTDLDFVGRVLYWNENMILAVSFRAPNEPGLARAAADIFLGRRGTGGPDAGASSGASTGASTGASGGTKLPATGNGGYLRGGPAIAPGGGLSRTAIAAAIAGAMIACTGVAVAAKRRA